MGGCTSKPQTGEYEGLMDPPTQQEQELNELNLYSGLKTIDRSNSSVFTGSQHTLKSLFIQHERDDEELLDNAPTLQELLLHAVDSKNLPTFENLSSGKAEEASEATQNGKSEPDLSFPCKQNSPVSVISNLAEEKAEKCAKTEAESIIRGIISQPNSIISEPKLIISEPKSSQSAENIITDVFPEPKASQVEKAEGEEKPSSAVERVFVQDNASVAEDIISNGGHLNADDSITYESSDVPSSHVGQFPAQTNISEAHFGHPEATHTEHNIGEAVFGQIEAVTELGSDQNTIETTDFGHIEKIVSDQKTAAVGHVEKVGSDQSTTVGHIEKIGFAHNTIEAPDDGQTKTLEKLGSDQKTAAVGHVEKLGSDQSTTVGHIEKLGFADNTIEALDNGKTKTLEFEQIPDVGQHGKLEYEQTISEIDNAGHTESSQLADDEKRPENLGLEQSLTEADVGLTEDSHQFDEEKTDEKLALEQITVVVDEPTEEKSSQELLLEQSIVEGNTEANPAELALEHNIIEAHGVSLPIKEFGLEHNISEAHAGGGSGGGQIEVGQFVEKHGIEHEAHDGQVEPSQLAEKLGFQDEHHDGQIPIPIKELDLGQDIIIEHIEASQSSQTPAKHGSLSCPIAESNVNENVVSNNLVFPIAEMDVNEGVLGNNISFSVAEMDVNEGVDGKSRQKVVDGEDPTVTQISMTDYTQLGMKLDEDKALLEASQSDDMVKCDPKPSEKLETLMSSIQGEMTTDHENLSQTEIEALGSNQG